ncbi:hypothetical protein ACFLYY_00660 [Patescibacteria group bacterium]
MEKKNPVKKVKRDQCEIVLFATVELEEWKFCLARVNEELIIVQTIYYGDKRGFTDPPKYIKDKIKKIIWGLSSKRKKKQLSSSQRALQL